MIVLNEDLFWKKVDRSGECWVWTAAKCKNGYGRVTVKDDGKWCRRLAHRISYYLTYGELPEELDHTCKNTSCVRPDHLEAVSHETNMERTRREKCRKGHNAWFTKGDRRYCLTCTDEMYIRLGRRVAPARTEVAA